MIPWIPLQTAEDLEAAWLRSFQHPVAFFKHSTRCSVSRMVKQQLEKQWSPDPDAWSVYYLDLLQYRSLSNSLTERSGQQHESPQLLVIRNGKLIYAASHEQIEVPEMVKG